MVMVLHERTHDAPMPSCLSLNNESPRANVERRLSNLRPLRARNIVTALRFDTDSHPYRLPLCLKMVLKKGNYGAERVPQRPKRVRKKSDCSSRREGPGLKPPCICGIFRRAKALRSIRKSKTVTFSAPSKALRSLPKAKTLTFSAACKVALQTGRLRHC
jgi:hypothetical protein